MARTVTMTENAIANYGEQWRGVRLRITHTATAYMPAAEFFARGKPAGYHPGYDSTGGELYDLQRVDTGEDLPMSLYAWEVS